MIYVRKRNTLADTPKKQPTNMESELLPQFPKALLQYTLFDYLLDDTYTRSQLAQHSQFADISQYSILWQAVVEGNQACAERIIQKHPSWLFDSSTVKDLSGRIIEKVTPFELAYGANDRDMFQMMLPYLDKLENGRERAFNRIKENFTESTSKKSYDFNPIITAITVNNVENIEEVKVVKEAINKFREDFKPGVIKKGEKHFNMQILSDAYKLYDALGLLAWSPRQRSLFWRQVIGYLQRMIPAYYAHAYCKDITDNKRSLKLNDGSCFYPRDLDSLSGLGFDFAITGGVLGGRHTLFGNPPGIGLGWGRSTNYVELTLLDLTSFLAPPLRCGRVGV